MLVAAGHGLQAFLPPHKHASPFVPFPVDSLPPSTSHVSVRTYTLGPVGRILVALGAIAILAALAIVLLPIFFAAIAIGLLFFLFVLIRLKLHSWWARSHAPNGPFDGRKNVRVRPSDDNAQ